MDVFVARQPIFNRDKEIVAYELLYRNSLKNFFDPSVSSSKATSILITNSHINIGMDNLVEDKYAFINFDSTLINNDIPSLLNKDSVVFYFRRPNRVVNLRCKKYNFWKVIVT